MLLELGKGVEEGMEALTLQEPHPQELQLPEQEQVLQSL